MFIERLQVKNIRGIRALDQELPKGPRGHAGWVVLAGDQGSGKSTVLQAIAATVLGPTNALVMMERQRDFVRQGEEEGRTAVWLSGTSEDHRAEADVTGSVRLAVTWHRNGGAKAHPPPGNHNFVTTQFWEGASFGAQPRGWCLAGYGATRRSGPASAFAVQLMSAPPRRSAVVTLYRNDATLPEPHTWIFGQSGNVKGKSHEIAQIVTQRILCDLFSDLTTSNGGPPEVEIDPFGTYLAREGGRLRLSTQSEGVVSLALLVSDIVRQMVGFFGERFMDGTVPSHREPIVIRHSGVILIDEFDVHLHPMVARGLGPWLEKHFPNVQFIVTENGLPEDSSTPSYRLINLNQAGAVGQAGSTIGRRGVPRRRSPSKDNVS